MKTLLLVLALSLALLAFLSGASPIVTEKEAKQLLRSRRQDRDRPSKPGFPDEPMRLLLRSVKYIWAFGLGRYNGQIDRDIGEPSKEDLEYMHHLLRLERRAEEQFLEHWLNPHCKPHCDRNVVHPV